MLDRIVLGTIGRVVADAIPDTESIRRFLQVLFENVVPRTVAKHQQTSRLRVIASSLLVEPEFDALAGQLGSVLAAIQMHRCFVFGHVVNAMRDDCSVSRTCKVMVVYDRRLLGVSHAFTIEIAQQFLLFRVDTDHRMTRVEVLLSDRGDSFKLSVAVSVLPLRSLLLRLATAKAVIQQQSRNDVSADRSPKLQHLSGDLATRKIRPFDIRSHRIARCMILDYLPEFLDNLWRSNLRLLAAAVFFAGDAYQDTDRPGSPTCHAGSFWHRIQAPG